MQQNQILALRTERGWSQQQLLRQLQLAAAARATSLPDAANLRVTLSGWENGRHRPTRMYRQLLAAALEVSECELGFGDQRQAVPLAAGSELVDYLTNMFALHARADQNMGSQVLIDVVTEQTKRAELWAESAHGQTRHRLLWIVGRYAEFCGWLHQDQGDFAGADHWTRRAIEISQELGDHRLVAYGLTRRSNIATEANKPKIALHLAEAALRQHAELNAGVIALAHRQLAISSAMLGDLQACVRAIRLGTEAVSRSESRSPESDYCTVSYITMEAGHALQAVSRLRDSIGLYDQALVGWPTGQHRDRGLCLARLATAYAGTEEIDIACSTGLQAASIVKAAPSARTASVLRHLRGQLNPHRRRSDVTDLREALALAV